MIKVEWYEEEAGILLWSYPPEWTLPMYEHAFDKSIALSQKQVGRLDVIEDQRPTNHLPRKYIYSVLDKHEKLDVEATGLGIVVILFSTPKIEFITRIANALPSVDRRFHTATTIEEARQLIAEDRASDVLKDPNTSQSNARK